MKINSDSKLSNSDLKGPSHVAIICDGNRTWARAHGLEAFLGHRQATQKVIEPLVDRAALRGIKYLTFWVFSTENWKRDKKEVGYLMDLFREFFDSQVQRLHEKNIRVIMIGDPSRLATDIQEKIKEGLELTKDNTGLIVVIAVNYGGHDELLRAVNKLLSSKLAGQEVTAAEIESNLDTKGIPDPDLIVRTSGQMRLSGFMSWQSAYSEFAFPKFGFPDFTPDRLDEVLKEFAARHRRFGK